MGKIFDWPYRCRHGNLSLRFGLMIAPTGLAIRRHAHAQVPAHWSPSVERVRLHVKGVVHSKGWFADFPEVGRCRGSWRWRRAKGLLDALPGENNSLRHGAA